MAGNSLVRAKADKGKSNPKPKEKVFHPKSRKAAQLERTHLRQHKLSRAKSLRSKVQTQTNDRYVFFHHALPPNVASLTLAEVHEIIQDIWLHRLDVQIAEEQRSRRKGEPRSAKEDKLLAQIEADKEEYRTGLELPDLTDPLTVDLYRKWEDGDPAYLGLLRFVRVSSSDPTVAVLVRRGQREIELEKRAAKEARARANQLRIDSMETD